MSRLNHLSKNCGGEILYGMMLCPEATRFLTKKNF